MGYFTPYEMVLGETPTVQQFVTVSIDRLSLPQDNI
jgi:hypothetical protein